MEYTKGEWKYCNGVIEVGGPAPSGHVIATMNGIGSRVEADARLIAAAPDLYEACKEALAWFNSEIISEFMKTNDVPYFAPLPELVKAIAKVEK